MSNRTRTMLRVTGLAVFVLSMLTHSVVRMIGVRGDAADNLHMQVALGVDRAEAMRQLREQRVLNKRRLAVWSVYAPMMGVALSAILIGVSCLRGSMRTFRLAPS